MAIVLIVAAVVGYLALKYLRRWLFLRRLRIARIAPEALKAKLEAREDITIIDLRSELDVVAVPFAIPGSRWIAAERLDDRLSEIPRDRDLILYCS
jgi:rhodanese-related sulfurtransferase